MSIVYDTEELTVTRRVANFSVRGRTGRAIPNYSPPTVGLVGSAIVGTSKVGP